MTTRAKQLIQELLSHADIQINGSRPWDIQIHNERTFARTLAAGSLGFGEAYMDGWWDSPALDEMFTRIFEAGIDEKITNWRVAAFAFKARLFNAQRPSKAFEIGERHYDVGNDLYARMLDKRIVYTCGYWHDIATPLYPPLPGGARSGSAGESGETLLDRAQEAKLDLVCRKIGLDKGMRVLDIGCGWGSFAKFAAEKYDVHVTGITVSKQQLELGQKLTQGLPVELRYQDYRDVTGQFDRVVSLGMFEHVGVKNYATYMEVVHRLLPVGGLFLLHTIGRNTSAHTNNPWIDKYIFPNSMLPSIKQIASAIEKRFVMEDWHNFGTDYDKTLQAWHANFEAAWPELREKYGDRFYRMWQFYLLSSAATFRTRRNQLWQVVLSKGGLKNGYQSLR